VVLLTVESQTTDEQSDDVEVACWRGFIAWWAQQKTEPVPVRAWEALALAEARHSALAGELTRSDHDGSGATLRALPVSARSKPAARTGDVTTAPQAKRRLCAGRHGERGSDYPTGDDQTRGRSSSQLRL
jgi:hypothetical protein